LIQNIFSVPPCVLHNLNYGSGHNIFVGEPERKRPLGRPRRRWEDSVRMDLMETGWKIVDRMHLAQDRDQWLAVVNTVMNLRLP
jgi:hypothetical protein